MADDLPEAWALLPCLILQRVLRGADDDLSYIVLRLVHAEIQDPRELAARIVRRCDSLRARSGYLHLLESSLPTLVGTSLDPWILERAGPESRAAVALDSREECGRLLASAPPVQGPASLERQRAAHVLRGVIMACLLDTKALLDLEAKLVRAARPLLPGANMHERRKAASALRRSFWRGGSAEAGAVNDLVWLRFGDGRRRMLSISAPAETDAPAAWPLREHEWYTGYTQGLDALRQTALGPDAPLFFLASDLTIVQSPTNFKAAKTRAAGWAYYFSEYFVAEKWSLAAQVAWRIAAAAAIARHAECEVLAETEARLGRGYEEHLLHEQRDRVDRSRAAFLSAVDRVSLEPSPERAGARAASPDGNTDVDLTLGFTNLPLDALTLGSTVFAASMTRPLGPEAAREAGEAWVVFGASARGRATQLLIEPKSAASMERVLAGLNDTWFSKLRFEFPRYYSSIAVPAVAAGIALLEEVRGLPSSDHAKSLVRLARMAWSPQEAERALRALRVWLSGLSRTVQYCRRHRTRFSHGVIKNFRPVLHRVEDMKRAASFEAAALELLSVRPLSDQAVSQMRASILQLCT